MFEDFEGKDHGDWKVAGEAFGVLALLLGLPDQQGQAMRKQREAGGGHGQHHALAAHQYRSHPRHAHPECDAQAQPQQPQLSFAQGQHGPPHQHGQQCG